MKNILKLIVEKFLKDEVTQLAAALAFYVAFSFSPLVIILYSLAGTLSLNSIDVIGTQIQLYLGSEAQSLFQMVVQHSQKNDLKTISIGGLIGLLSLLFSASLIFGELRIALNKIFEIPSQETQQSIWAEVQGFLKNRLRAIGMVLSFDLLIILSLFISSLILNSLPIPNRGHILILTAFFSWVFYAFTFTLMLRFVPIQRQNWIFSFKGGYFNCIFISSREGTHRSLHRKNCCRF